MTNKYVHFYGIPLNEKEVILFGGRLGVRATGCSGATRARLIGKKRGHFFILLFSQFLGELCGGKLPRSPVVSEKVALVRRSRVLREKLVHLLICAIRE